MANEAGAGEKAAAHPARRRSRPITFYLFILALVALVPAFVFSAILLQRNNEAQEAVVETLVNGTSRSIIQAVEREVTANISTLRVLTTSPALLAGDFQSFHVRARLALQGTDSYVYLVGPDGTVLLTTRYDFGTPLGPTIDPDSARKAIETRSVVVSNAVFGSLSQRWVYNVLQPLFIEGRGAMVLGLSRHAEDLTTALLSNKLPDGWKVALVDSNKSILASSEGVGDPGTHLELSDLTPITNSGGWINVTMDGAEYLTVIQRSTLTGWTLYAWAPRALIAQPLATAFWSLLVGGILLAAVVVLIIYWVSLQIGRSVHGVEDDAKLLGRGHTVPARNYPISEIATVSESLAEASRRRKAAETEVRLLMRELAHRSKNQMTVIAAMAKQSAKGAESVPDFVAGFERRIYSLARSTDLLLAHGPAGIDIREVLLRQVDPICPIETGRVAINGPKLLLNTQAAQLLGMAAHELATNALKHGAFATENGRIDISWDVFGDKLELFWREHGGKAYKQFDRRGFGTIVLETMVGRTLGAEVDRSLGDDGIVWHFVIPLSALDVHAEPEEAEPEDAEPEDAEPDESEPQPAIAVTGAEK